MSHNKIKVGGQSPNSSGEISPNIENLSDVTSAPIENGGLIYNGSSFRSKGKPTSQQERYYSFVKTTDNYGTSLSYSNNDYWIWRHSTGTIVFKDTSITRNTATSANSPVTNSNWTESLTLTTSGTYLLLACVACGDNFNSNDSCTIQWSDGSAISNKVHLNSEGVFGSLIWAVKTITSSTTVRLVVTDVTGTCRPISAEQARACTVQVFQLNT